MAAVCTRRRRTVLLFAPPSTRFSVPTLLAVENCAIIGRWSRHSTVCTGISRTVLSTIGTRRSKSVGTRRWQAVCPWRWQRRPCSATYRCRRGSRTIWLRWCIAVAGAPVSRSAPVSRRCSPSAVCCPSAFMCTLLGIPRLSVQDMAVGMLATSGRGLRAICT